MLEDVYEELLQILQIQSFQLSAHNPINNIHPCWINSIQESKLAFEEAVGLINLWGQDKSVQINTLRREDSIEWIRASGNTFYLDFEVY